MYSKKALYEQLVTMMEELFEIESERVLPEALLGEDLDIDSIDAVDMATELQKITGQKIQPAAFKGIRTVQDLVDAAHAVLGQNDVALPS
jgi:acyl carrier protein